MRLDKLSETRGDVVDIEWRAFLLRTEPKTTDRAKFAAYTESWQRPAAMEPAAEFRMWDDSSGEPPSSSLPAQMAAKAVERLAPESYRGFHHALLVAYFTHNRDISDWTELGAIADEAGIDTDRLEALLDQERQALAGEVIDDHNAAIERQIHAVPSVLFGDGLVVPGAQDVEVYEQIVDRLVERL